MNDANLLNSKLNEQISPFLDFFRCIKEKDKEKTNIMQNKEINNSNFSKQLIIIYTKYFPMIIIHI